MNKTSALPEFQRYQFAFTAHIRDPKAHPRPAGVEARRMNIYNGLLYNNIEGFLLSCFPVLRQVLGARKWARLVRAFFSVHRSHTPYFRQIPGRIHPVPAERMDRIRGTCRPICWRWRITNGSSWCSRYRPAARTARSTRRRPARRRAAVESGAGQPALRLAGAPHRAAPQGAAGRNASAGVPRRRGHRSVQRDQCVYRASADAAGTGHADRPRRAGEIAAESRHPDPALILQAGGALLDDLRARGAILGAARPA
jgi:uncharacterized protein